MATEPIARKLAQFIDPSMQMFDPSSFEVSRIMYKPSCSLDSEYRCFFEDKPFLSADGVLALYQDWHNVNEWPQVPGAADSRQHSATEQENPLQKNGIVGAFCRVYDIYRALEELLPGVYEPVDNMPDRYTYAGGSTTGGAVIYDNGLFLFSHHATDPCGGKLVNAFDLVRLHKFGDKDDDAKPDTPTHKMPSFAAMCEFACADSEVSALIAKEKGEKVLQEFGNLSQQIKSDPDKQIALGQLDGQALTVDVVKQVLSLLGICTRLNVITNKAEILGAPRDWSAENAVNNLPTLIRDVCRKSGVRGISKEAIMDSLALINDQNRINPVLDMLYSTSWNGQDRLPVVYMILGKTDVLSQTLIKKWLWQCVAMAHNESGNPYGADGVLTLTGPQGLGKTSFFRWLATDPKWFAEGITLDMSNKDSVLQALRAWLSEMGELDGTFLRNLPGMKAFLTSAVDSIRPPYARSSVDRPRHASFCATVNGDDFLKDETGNRRFWTVAVKEVDLNLMRNLDTIWVQQLWAQVLKLYDSNHQGFRLTSSERQQLEAVNMQHMQLLPYEDEVLNQLDFDLPLEKWTEVSASQIAERISSRPDSRHIGRALSKISRMDSRISFRRSEKKRSYLLPLKTYTYGFLPEQA